MKLLNLLLICCILLACANSKKLIRSNQKKQQSASNSSLNPQALSETWKLVFSDEFNTVGDFDNSKWTYSPRWSPSWAKYLTSTPDYASLNGSSLILKMDNSIIAADNVPYHSGGIQTSTKFSFRMVRLK